MQVLTQAATSAFLYSTRTTISQLMNEPAAKAGELMQELAQQGIQPSGAQVWIYEGADGKPETEFTLRIAIPVAQKGKNTEEFHFSEIPEFKHVKTIHNGSYAEFPQVYEKFMGEIFSNQHQITDTCREVYINCDFEDQTKCVTEILMGVQ